MAKMILSQLRMPVARHCVMAILAMPFTGKRSCEKIKKMLD
jgi:hypothetical protein